MDPVFSHSVSTARLSAEQEFLLAIQEYKQQSGRLFPTWSEVLEVAQRLGYSKARGGDVPADRTLPQP